MAEVQPGSVVEWDEGPRKRRGSIWSAAPGTSCWWAATLDGPRELVKVKVQKVRGDKPKVSRDYS
jgi:hypothetical protein